MPQRGRPGCTSNPFAPYFRFPFFAADVLASNAMILQAVIEGGWNQV